MKQKKIEILAPAGNMESLKAAVSAGCDAVYLGGTLFSARAFAGNFNHEEMLEAVKYCHMRGVHVYVTMNTLLFEDEIDNAMKEVGFLYHADVDALLVQDLGLFHRIRIEYPDLALHCSTQMHIHNVNGCRFMKQQGAQRVVLARETPIEIVRECVDTGVEIEIFAYGALCISYSGQCLMSQAIKNRSGNRGMCAQMCRLRYQPSDGHTSVKAKEGEYLLSPRDLNVIDRIPELIEAGVSSLKIEGRMKRPEYVWLVTKTFREAVDHYYEGKPYHLSQEREKELMLMFNRGFTEGHLFHAPLADRMSQYRPNHRGVRCGTVIKYEHGRVLVKLSDSLHQHDGLRILNEPSDTGLTAVRIENASTGLLVNHADSGDLVWLDCHSKPVPKAGQSLQKTSDADLISRIDERMKKEDRKISISVSYQAEIGKKLRLTAADSNGNQATAESSVLLSQAEKAPLTKEKIESSLTKSGDTPFEVHPVCIKLENVFLPVSVLNETRRTLLEKLMEIRSRMHARRGHIPYGFTLASSASPSFHLLVESNELVWNNPDILWIHGDCKLPVVDENDCDKLALSEHILSQIGSLNHPLKDCLAGMNLNCCNSYAMAFLLNIKGINGIIFSSEVSERSIGMALRAFEERYGFHPYTARLVYGRRDLMYIKDRFMKEEPNALLDFEKRLYPVRHEHGLTMIKEPDPYVSENRYADGSVILLNGEKKGEQEKILKEAYEELHQRI